MKKYLLSLCLVLGLAACGDKTPKQQDNGKPTIKIGATLPLTGNLAYVGVGAQNALQMVLEKWQEKDTKYNYEIVYEDDAIKPQQAALNTQRFISIEKAKIVISVFGIVDRAVDDIANQHKIISLSCSYGKNDVPEYGINTGTQNEEIYANTLQQLKKRNVKTVALVGSNSAVSNATLDYAAQHLPQDGIEVIASERYNIGEKDYRLSIQKIEQKNPDYYLVFGIEPMNSIFVRQYHELTNKNNLASLGSFSNISPKNFPPVDGVWSIYLVGGTDAFEKAYTDKFGTRVEGCSASLYDGLDVLITAFENTPRKEGEVVPNNADVLKKVEEFKKWDGAFGPTKIGSDRIFRSIADVRMYQDGKWVKIKE